MAEIAPGFRVPEVAHLLHLLHPRVERELDLARHGLALSAADLPTLALQPGRVPILLPSDPAGAEGLSADDREAWTRLKARLLRFARALEPFRGEPPPRLGVNSRTDLARLARMGWAIRSLGREEMREFLRMAAINIADVVEDELSDPLPPTVAFDVCSAPARPRAPDVMALLIAWPARSQGGRERWRALRMGRSPRR
jgi:hypothetical protein